MSRPQRSNMGPPQDIVMGPPPLPPQLAQSTSQKSRESQDVAEKYRRLKRKYFDLEDKHKETQIQLKTSGERNLKWRAERELLLDRITELETNPQINPGAPIPAPPFTAFPRSLLSTNSQKHFVANLRQAIDEIQAEDPDLDPFLLSRHVGPEARKRQEAELKERQEEEAREARRVSRRPRAAQKSKDLGTPLTYAPAHQGTPPVLVSSSGTRLRLKPPAPPSGDAGPAPASSSGVHGPTQHHPGQMSVVHHAQHRGDSPISPVLSPEDEYPPPAPLSPSEAYQHVASSRPGAVPMPPPSQSQMQMTLRTSSSGSLATASRPSDLQRHAKPKRLKAHTVQSKSYSIPTVPRDKKGRPLLPLNVGIMTVINLGEVCMREHFHTERYIFPIGYEVTRRYLSTLDPHKEVVYHCQILDGGDGPKFQIIAEDQPEKPVIAGTATGAWSVIVRSANHIRHRQHSNSVSGPDFFGLGQNTIKHLIQELPNARNLKDYVWQHFAEGGPLGGRHAAVIPALPDEHEVQGQGQASGYYVEREMELDRPRELQIIQVENEDSKRMQAYLPPPPNMKPITFQQEYQEYMRPPERERERERELPMRRERRSSRASNPAYDDYVDTKPSTRGESPGPHRRTLSHSPVMHRERERDRDGDRDRDTERDRYSPPPHTHVSRSHSRSSISSPRAHRHSPYQSSHAHNGDPAASRHYASAPSPPPVPAPFASIMHAYPVAPMASAPEVEYAYVNGNGVRRNGSMSTFSGGDR